jgi:branched-chain amino acid transport system substrate-binding protein
MTKYNDPNPMSHYTLTFSGTWFFLHNILPIAIQKFGGITADAVRQATMQIDIPNGQTVMWYGLKFEPPESEFAGQNMRAFPVVTQWIDGKQHIVFPEALRAVDPIFPLPSSHPLGK